MGDNDWLASHFERHRPHLRAVAYRMLGSLTEADDAVQDAWLRAGDLFICAKTLLVEIKAAHRPRAPKRLR